jgi:phosphatidate cytidylyltransferase
MTPANHNLAVRLATALVLGPLLVGVILWRRTEPFTLVVHGGVAVGLVELYWITLREDPVWARVAGVLLGVFVSATLAWCPRPEALAAALVIATLASGVIHLVRPGDISTAPARTGLMLFGILYIPLLLTPLALLKRMPSGVAWIILSLTVTWFADTGAYFTGRAIGRHKLYPAISPGKTVEGAIGGLVFSIGAAVLAHLWYMPELPWLDGVLVALPASALGQAGDLVESLVKRAFKVKDSGWILPGHGGLLDRIDAVLFAAPYVYLYARYVFPVLGAAAGHAS